MQPAGNVFHGHHERRIGLRRDDPLLGLDRVFLSVRPIVLLLARSMTSSTTLFRKRVRPLGTYQCRLIGSVVAIRPPLNVLAKEISVKGDGVG